MAAERPLIITRWARQSDRAPAALAPGYAKLDERGLAELVAETAHFGRHVRFFGASGAEEGDWETLLVADPTVLLALIATLDVEEPKSSLRRRLLCLRDADRPQCEAALRLLLQDVFRLARIIDRWVGPADRLERLPSTEAAIGLVERALSELLGPRLRQLMGVVVAAERAGLVEAGLLDAIASFHPRWRIDEVEGLELLLDPEQFWRDWVAAPVEEAVDGFLFGLEALVAEARTLFEAGLEHAAHAPQVGLVFAFLKLFGREQESLNALPGRIARFYHERLVGTVPRPAKPDHLYLSFRPLGSKAGIPEIARGHIFEAGVGPDGGPVCFAADSGVAVTGVRLSELRLWGPIPAQGAPQALAAAAFPVEESGAVLHAFAGKPPLPVAELGLVVAGTAFQAEGGRRRFELTLDLTDLDWPAGVDAGHFPDLLKDAFRLSLGTEVGWADLPSADTSGSSLHEDRAEAVFRFSLAADGPALAGEAAALRLLLAQEVRSLAGTEVAPLAVFAPARVTGGRVRIAVQGLDGLALSTSAGPAAAAAGIPAFGAPASCGGWIAIEHPALARGGLDRVALTLDWADPPPHCDGFRGYYREYAVDLDRRVRRPGHPLFRNEDFRVRFSARLAGGPASAEGPLFPGAAVDGPVPSTSEFELAAGAPAADAVPPGVRLTLTAPAFAFGDLLYPLNVARATALAAAGAARARPRKSLWAGLLAALAKRAEAPLKLVRALWKKLEAADARIEGRSPLPAALQLPPPTTDPPSGLAALMPNPPWRAALAGLRLDYEAHFDFGGRSEGGELLLFHWTPFDGAVPVAWTGTIALLPPVPSQPCFDLLLDDVVEGAPLSLLFVRAPGDETPPVRWQVQGGDGAWRPLDPAALLDGTAGLTRTGILTLSAGFARGPSLRLRAAAAGALPHLTLVAADALRATRIVSGSETSLAPLPARTIASIVGVPGIAVRQPLESFGGVPADTSSNMSANASERLRHRGRSSLSWDQERLVLGLFPEVERVRVLPARDSTGRPTPGGALVILVPTAGGTADPLRPSAAPELRAAVVDELSARASAFASIAAVDPVYAEVAVTAQVALAQGAHPDRLRAEIVAFLSPSAAEGPDLPDSAGPEELAAALGRFLRSRTYVEAVGKVTASLATSPGRPWVVPVAGPVAIASIEPESRWP
jgi:hypothetical protein